MNTYRKSLYLVLSLLLLLQSSCVKITLNYDIEEKTIDGKTYYVIDSREDLVWLSRKDCYGLNPHDVTLSETKKEKMLISKMRANYIQTCDIDLSPIYVEGREDSINASLIFQGIGDEDLPFAGTYDGQGHKITKMTLDRQDSSNVGMFGVILEGSVKNLRLEDCVMHGDERVGTLCGWSVGSILANIHSSGQINISSSKAGGVVGALDESAVYNSSFDGQIKDVSNSLLIGGISGECAGSNIINSKSTGKIYGNNRIGGICGDLTGSLQRSQFIKSIKKGSIIDCYSNMTIHSNSMAGGIASDGSQCHITGCTFAGNITSKKGGGILGDGSDVMIVQSANMGQIECDGESDSNVGGIAGNLTNMYKDSISTVHQCYNYGTVLSRGSVGGIASEAYESSISDVYSDGFIQGKKSYTGGILGFARPKTKLSGFYSTGTVKAIRYASAAISTYYGTRVVSKFEEDLFKKIAEDMGGALNSTGLVVKTSKQGDVVASACNNGLWCVESTGQRRAINKINHLGDKIDVAPLKYEQIQGSKKLTNKNWCSNVGDRKLLPFFAWQPVVIQYTKPKGSTEIVVYNNKNSCKIKQVGYLVGNEAIFDFDTDAMVKMDSLEVGEGQWITFSDNEIQSKGEYMRPFAIDTEGQVWYGSCRSFD
ncbi:hypothetical protein OAT16_11745 [Prolixibacteraceae bacterium]|nr:hypothetical protein [Prolixibacteraceae bacterium]